MSIAFKEEKLFFYLNQNFIELQSFRKEILLRETALRSALRNCELEASVLPSCQA